MKTDLLYLALPVVMMLSFTLALVLGIGFGNLFTDSLRDAAFRRKKARHRAHDHLIRKAYDYFKSNQFEAAETVLQEYSRKTGTHVGLASFSMSTGARTVRVFHPEECGDEFDEKDPY